MKLRAICYVVSLTIILISASAQAGGPKVRKHPVNGIEGEYVVVLDERIPSEAVDGVARSVAASYGATLKTVWASSLRGFLVMVGDEILPAIAADPRVAYVEQNVRVHFEPPRAETESQVQPPISGTQWTSWNGQYLWYLDRLDEPSWANRDSQYNMCPAGRGTVAYVIDLGIWGGHSEFEIPTRVVRNIDFSDDRPNHSVPFGDDTTNGCHGVVNAWHGTAVASSLGGTHIGSAKPQIVSLKVFSCALQATATNFFNALDWINSTNNPFRSLGGVINHSGYIPVWDGNFTAYGDAVERTVRATNYPFFTSADNFSTDSCQFAADNRAYTNINHNGTIFSVGGTSVNPNDGNDPNDYRWQVWNSDGTAHIGPESGSNGGACVSVYAPAVSIYVASNQGTATDYFWSTGTSFSSPLVAGMAARYIEQYQSTHANQIPTYQQVYNFLLGQATATILQGQTSPTYWMCVQEVNGLGYNSYTYATRPANCPGGYTGPWQFNSVTNTSNARMVYWDNGTCQ